MTKKKRTNGKAKLRPIEHEQLSLKDVASLAPKRDQVNFKLLKRLLAEYVSNEGKYQKANTERDRLALAIVEQWGAGILTYQPRGKSAVRFLPSSRSGRILLRRLGVESGIIE